MDKRGLHNPNPTIRSRVSYLFLRYVKQIKERLKPYLGQILQSVADCLQISLQEVEAEIMAKNSSGSSMNATGIEAQKGSISSFENQLSLFEAVGRLISYESLPNKQLEYLTVSLIATFFGHLLF